MLDPYEVERFLAELEAPIDQPDEAPVTADHINTNMTKEMITEDISVIVTNGSSQLASIPQVKIFAGIKIAGNTQKTQADSRDPLADSSLFFQGNSSWTLAQQADNGIFCFESLFETTEGKREESLTSTHIEKIENDLPEVVISRSADKNVGSSAVKSKWDGIIQMLPLLSGEKLKIEPIPIEKVTKRKLIVKKGSASQQLPSFQEAYLEHNENQKRLLANSSIETDENPMIMRIERHQKPSASKKQPEKKVDDHKVKTSKKKAYSKTTSKMVLRKSKS